VARNVVAITRLTATATVGSPLHVGGWMSAPGADAALARDGRGRLVLPGSSLAGALRAALGQPWQPPPPGRAPRSTPATPIEEIWGAADLDGVGASRVVVRDAAVSTAPDGAGRRDGVGIDRAWGSAAEGLLYGRELVPAGAMVQLELEVHSTTSSETTDLDLLGQIAAVLTVGLPVGARTSRGLGLLTADADAIEVTQVRYDSPRGYWETAGNPKAVPLPAAAPGDGGALDVEVHWIPLGPVSVGSGQATPSVAHLPLAESHPDNPDLLRLVLPGTALAGALRSRAEFICRTVGGQDPPEDFSDQLSGAPLAAVLFGHAAGVPGSTASPLVVHDCPSTTTIPAAGWDAITNPPDGPDSRPDLPRSVPASNDDGTPTELRRTEHVGIDRWTGGAGEGRLFCEFEPHGFRYHPIRLRLRRDRITDPGIRDAATALLLLVLRELAAGRVPLGGRQQRGLGDIDVTKVVLRGAGLAHDDIEPPDLTTPALAGLRHAWRAHIGREDTP